MHILVTGLNHRTAPVEMREQFSITSEQLQQALLELKETKSVQECVIVSTCNRMEIYTVVDRIHLCGHYIKEFLEDKFQVERSQFVKYLYMYEDERAVEHLFRVTSGLDSMIIGETQILGQVRNAFFTAQNIGTTGSVFNTLFKQAVTMAKQAHAETTINENAVSVSYAAVELGKQIFSTFTGKTVLIIGAGKTGELAVKHLYANGAERVIVANRTVDKAKDLSAQFNGEYCAMDELEDKLMAADIVISSTGAPGIVLTKEQVQRAVKNRKSSRPLFMIDIAVPRDLDPQISTLRNVLLYDIDDLEGIIENNLDQRRKAAKQIEGMISKEITEFYEWLQTLGVGPVIRALQKKSNKIHEEVMQSLINKLPELSERELKIIRKLSKSMINQVIHDPILKVKEMALQDRGGEQSLQIFSQLFDLEHYVEDAPSSNKVEMLFAKNHRIKAVQEEGSSIMHARELSARS